MSKSFQVGFGTVDITPAESVKLAGYFYARQSTGVHDRLHARAMAFSDGASRAVLCVVDVTSVTFEIVAEVRRLVKASCGLAPEELIVSTVHTHTGPALHQEPEYAAALPPKIAEAIALAVADLKPRTLKAGRGREETVQNIRRYRMKDGSVRTNPGIMNPDVVAPIGEPDREVLALQVSENDGAVGGVVNFGLHCDCIGGTEISADWTYFVRQAMSREFGRNVNILTPIGTAGDVNHFDVFHPAPAIRGFDLSEKIGNRIAMAAMLALDGGKAIEPGPVVAVARTVEAPIRVPTAEELREAKIIWAQPPPTDKDFTMDRVEARRRIRAADMDPVARLDITVLAAGNVAFVGLPAEVFSELGRIIKQGSPFAYTFICTLANGLIGYVGAKQNYAEGGYETTCSLVVPGTGELIAGAAVELLHEAAKARG